MPTGFLSVDDNTRTQINIVIILNLDYSPITGISRSSPEGLKFLFPSAITTFSRIQTDDNKTASFQLLLSTI